jgi:hypothetical protein
MPAPKLTTSGRLQSEKFCPRSLLFSLWLIIGLASVIPDHNILVLAVPQQPRIQRSVSVLKQNEWSTADCDTVPRKVLVGKRNHAVLMEEQSATHNFHETVKLSNETEGRSRISHKKASLLTILLATLSVGLFRQNYGIGHLILSSSPGDNRSTLLFLTGVVAILYWGESWNCSTQKYLTNTVSPVVFGNQLNAMRGCPPRIRWHVECYHYRRGSYTNRRTSHHERTKVVTHRATREYQYSR